MRYKENSGELEARRAQALETAFQMFAQSSIEAVNMADIARASGMGMATLYRYFSVKRKLVIELGTLKWRQYAHDVEQRRQAAHGDRMNSIDEFGFYLDCYVDLLDHQPDLLRFNANFDQYIRHENAPVEELQDYYDSVGYFAAAFDRIYAHAQTDHTMRLDISKKEMFFSSLYALLAIAQKYAAGLIYPPDHSFDCRHALVTQRDLLLSWVRA